MASTFKCLEKTVFPIVILDECSQLTEPTSLIPISRFGCQQLVALIFFFLSLLVFLFLKQLDHCHIIHAG